MGYSPWGPKESHMTEHACTDDFKLVSGVIESR